MRDLLTFRHWITAHRPITLKSSGLMLRFRRSEMAPGFRIKIFSLWRLGVMGRPYLGAVANLGTAHFDHDQNGTRSRTGVDVLMAGFWKINMADWK